MLEIICFSSELNTQIESLVSAFLKRIVWLCLFMTIKPLVKNMYNSGFRGLTTSIFLYYYFGLGGMWGTLWLQFFDPDSTFFQNKLYLSLYFIIYYSLNLYMRYIKLKHVVKLHLPNKRWQ